MVDRDLLDRLERFGNLLADLTARLPGAVRDLHELTVDLEVERMRELRFQRERRELLEREPGGPAGHALRSGEEQFDAGSEARRSRAERPVGEEQ